MDPQPLPLVRPAGEHDLETLVSFNSAMAQETEGRALDPARLRAGVRRALLGEGAAERGRYLVAEAGDRVVGALFLTREWSDWRDGWFLWIQSVFVAPEARGRGVYTALHAAAEAEARSLGACGLRLYVDAGNRGAQAVYGRLGMVPTRYRLFETDFGADRAPGEGP